MSTTHQKAKKRKLEQTIPLYRRYNYKTERDWKKDCHEVLPSTEAPVLKEVKREIGTNEILVWDPFLGRSVEEPYSSVNVKKKCGFKVFYEKDVDFFSYSEPPEGIDMIITNPPFSQSDKILDKLFEWGIPFIVLLPWYLLSNPLKKYDGKYSTGLCAIDHTVPLFHKMGEILSTPPFPKRYFWLFGHQKNIIGKNFIASDPQINLEYDFEGPYNYHEVEKVIDFDASVGHYLIKWKSCKTPTWEPLENLTDCAKALEEFH